MDRLSPRKTRKATPPTNTAPQKSLAIPKNTPPDDYRAYVEHPEIATLNQIMLHYLDMEEILKLYRQNHEQFETRQALNTLSQRFEVPRVRSFKRLLKYYDRQYATVRSYLYTNRSSKEILYQAALEGNIQAFYNQLKLYPKLQEVEVYNQALAFAANGGHEAIIELLFELGAVDKHVIVLMAAATGGQLALVQKELAKGVKGKYIRQAVRNAAAYRHKAVVATLLDYSTNDQILTAAMNGAGESNDTAIIGYVISRGGTDYATLIEIAAKAGHFSIVRQYWDKLTNPGARLDGIILQSASCYADLDTIKFIVERQLVTQEQLENCLERIKYQRRRLVRSSTNKPSKLVNEQLANLDSIIAYLESKGVVTQDVESESSEEAMSD